MSPSPRTADPLLTTATRLAREVYSETSDGSRAISRQASATPGEYARLRSSCVWLGFVGEMEIFPGIGSAW